MQVLNKTVGNRGTLRKVLSMLLAVAMIVSMLPVTAYASAHLGCSPGNLINQTERLIFFSSPKISWRW